MTTEANIIIDALGGTTAVAKMIEAPTSTVHSWRGNGIPASRLAHLKLAAHALRIPWPGDTVAECSLGSDYRTILCDVCERRVDGEIPNACTFVDCPHTGRSENLGLAA